MDLLGKTLRAILASANRPGLRISTTYCVNFGEKELAFPARMHLLSGPPSPGTFLAVNLSEGLIF